MTDSTGTLEESPPSVLFSGYAPPAGTFDEVLTSQGRLRSSWQKFAAGLLQLGPTGLAQRSEQARRLLRENGVTYNIFGASQGPDRPWELDPLPLVLDAAEWRTLSAGITQRVTLLNRILADLYGPQQLLKQGILPPKIVLGHPGYLLPCHGIRQQNDQFLHLHACHLARQPNGQWLVMADRTQGPSGAGYAVENRIVTSRILPHDYQNLHVERLAPFYIRLREALLALAPHHRDNPRIVLLSPGPRSSMYFEDTYLARYLNYTLVEGGDLTVRGSHVYLKTLGGLLPVDVVLRRVRDEDCDSLELRGDSQLGPPGMLQAVRAGQVVVANAIGSGFLEAPALMPFFGSMCRFFFGEDLKIPTIPSWWCGRSEDLKYVEQHFDELIIRPAFSYRTAGPIAGWLQSPTEKARLLETIRRRPSMFVAQSRVVRSTAPVWNNGQLQPWHVGLRTFTMVSGNQYHVLPGGISRVSISPDSLGESISGGEKSKDVWILSDHPVPTVTLLQPSATVLELRRSGNDLPSRVADNLLWLGRHVERAEGMVRHVRSAVVRLTNDLEPASISELAILIRALLEPDPDAIALPLGDTLSELQSELLRFVFDEQLPTGLRATLQSLHHTASVVRDRISIDSWRIVNQLNIDVLFPWDKKEARLVDVLLLLNQMLNLLSALSGLGTESMTRGPGWRFLDMGRRIERGLHTLGVVRRTLVNTRDDMLTPLLEAVLEIADSSMTYRYRYMASLQLAPLLDLLLVDETNPRAVGFQLNALSEHVRDLPREQSDPLRNQEERIMLAAQVGLRLSDVDALAQCDNSGTRSSLAKFLDQISSHLRHLSDSITQTYLTHTGPSRQLGVTAFEAPEQTL